MRFEVGKPYRLEARKFVGEDDPVAAVLHGLYVGSYELGGLVSHRFAHVVMPADLLQHLRVWSHLGPGRRNGSSADALEARLMLTDLFEAKFEKSWVVVA
jgi:hypothetical protein